MFICFPKDGSGKGIVLNINHDIVPQAIGKCLIGVSRDNKISKGNATQHTTTLQEEGIEEKEMTKQRTNLFYIKSAGV